jgi:ABC-2 type transport system permease protein
MLEYWIVGVIVIVVVLSAAGLAGVLGAVVAESPETLIPNVAQAAAAQLPACLIFLGLTLLVFAVLPRATIPLGWTLIGAAAIVGIFGPILQLPEWMTNLSPFTHTPVPTGDDTDWSGGVWMLGIGLAAGVAAIAAMNRRELASGG